MNNHHLDNCAEFPAIFQNNWRLNSGCRLMTWTKRK